MTEENITDQSLPSQEGGEAAVENEVEANSTATQEDFQEGGDAKTLDQLSLKELQEYTGKKFESKDAALKSIKDTFSYVGKKTEDVSNDLKNQGYMTKSEFENALFYRDNPEHAQNQEVLDSIAKAKGISLSEAAKTESYLKLFEGASNFAKSQSKKSVLETNSRLAGMEDKTKKVGELVRSGNKEAAANEAAKTVMEAFGL